VRNDSGLDGYHTSRLAELHADELKQSGLRTQAIELSMAIADGRERLARLEGGHVDDPRSHLRHAAEPQPPSVARRRAYGEAWAALSVGLLIVALAVIVWFRILPPVTAIIVLLGSYIAIESFFDRNIGDLLLRITVVLAIISSIILIGQYLREILLAGLFGLGLLLVLDNLGELRRRIG